MAEMNRGRLTRRGLHREGRRFAQPRVTFKMRSVRDQMLGFSPSGEAALARSAYFPSGRTSKQYPPRLAKECILLGRSLGWRTEAVSGGARELARSGDRIHSPQPAVSRGLLMETRWPTYSYKRYLFRAQSECLSLEKMYENPAPKAPAVRGTWGGHIAIKLNRRQHVAGGPMTA